MRELIGIVVGIAGIIICAGGVIDAAGSGHCVHAVLWSIGVIFSFKLADEALESVDDDSENIRM